MPAQHGRKCGRSWHGVGKGASNCVAAKQACTSDCRQVAIANTPVQAKAVSSVCRDAPPFVVDGAGDASVGNCKGARTIGARAMTVAQLGMASSSLASSTGDCTTPPLLML